MKNPKGLFGGNADFSHIEKSPIFKATPVALLLCYSSASYLTITCTLKRLTFWGIQLYINKTFSPIMLNFIATVDKYPCEFSP